ncbi:MAG: Asp-tRNA(Asn)/Glu-tRNA(Gln) amidotransferase subunit GatA [Acidobacteriota bacterium]|nr:Asp-tRNA(Asn)/Glu-tRNA(Gln) amidotransferase subunit GatA [Acidobacteriota bacterium]
MSIGELSVTQAVAAIGAKELSGREVFAHYRARAAEREASGEEALNCFCWIAEDDGRQVPEAPADAALGGVPLAVKDLFCTEGVPSQSGSRILAGYRPPYTATAVARLQAAGVSLLGKTNQDEFAMGSSSENCAFGPVLNPWDRTRVPGGSSGGSAAAVAAGLAPWALGSDTGGSVRQPAALCGIVGLRPTYGTVSRYGMIAFASSLDQAGPLTRTVADAALMLRQMAGKDPCDATSLALPSEIALPRSESLEGVRLGVPEEVESGGVEAGVLEAFRRTLELAEGLGAEIVTDVKLPHARHALSAYYVLAPAEASSNLARYDGVRYGLRVGGEAGGGDLGAMYTETRHDGFGPEVKRRIMLGTYVLSAGYYDAYYGQAQRVRTMIVADYARAFEEADFIVTPTASEVAFAMGAKTEDPWSMYMNDYFTVPQPLAGLPAISIPCGLAGDGEGLPVGFQLCGPAFSENGLLAAAHALEGAIGFDGSRARL